MIDAATALDAARKHGFVAADVTTPALDPSSDALLQLVQLGLLSDAQAAALRIELQPAPGQGTSASSPTLVAPSGPAPTVDEVAATWTHDATERLAVPLPGAPAPERYDQLGELGRGGMGVVTREFDRQLERQVAKKVMLGESAEQLERFLREARLTARLDHPGMPPVHDLGSDDAGAFFTMKLVRGRSLDELLDGDPPARSALLEIFLKICDAMRYAHARAIIHRDLKPANVMVGEYGEVLVMDWGLAKVIGEADLDSTRAPVDSSGGTALTLDGQIVGTPAYMPPEQANGEVEQLDARTDVWSLGALLFQLLFGRAPYDGPTMMAVLAAAQQGKVDWPERGDAPPELVAITRKAMAPEPAARYQNVDELAADVRRYRDHRGVSAYRDTLVGTLTKLVKRHPTVAAISALIVIGLAVAARVEQARARHQARAATLARTMLVGERNRRKTDQRRRRAIVPYAEAQRLLRNQPTRATLIDRVIPLLEASRKHDAGFAQATSTLAELRLALGDAAEAETLLVGLVDQRATPLARFDLVRARLALGRVDAARDVLRGQPDDNPSTVAGRGWIALATGQLEDARRCGAAILARAAKQKRGRWRRLSWAGHWILARALFDPDSGVSSSRARPHLDHVVLEAPAFPLGRVYSARLHILMGQSDRARADLQSARQLIPDDRRVQVLGAQLDGDFTKPAGLALFERLIAETPDDPLLHGLRIRALWSMGRRKEAREAFRALERKVMPSPDPLAAMVLARTAPTLELQSSGMIRHFRRLIASHPQMRGPLYQLLGRSLERKGQREEARRAFLAAIEGMPDDPQPVVALAQLLGRTGKALEAVEMLARLRAAHPGDNRVQSAYATLLVRVAMADPRRKKDAIEALDTALRSSPNSVSLHIKRARLRLQLGEITGAEQDFILAAALAARQSRLKTTLNVLIETALLYEKIHDYVRAKRCWDRYISLSPQAAVKLHAVRQSARRCGLLVELEHREPKTDVEAGLKGRLLREKRQFAKALPYLDRAIEALEGKTRRDDYQGIQSLLLRRLERAEVYLALGRNSDANIAGHEVARIAIDVATRHRLQQTSLHNMREIGRQGYLIALAGAVSHGDRDEAFRVLRALRKGWPAHIEGLLLTKTIESLRKDPRWARMLREVREKR